MTTFDRLHLSETSRNTRFQLVNEQGSGEDYAGLVFEVVDGRGVQYSGYLDAFGKGHLDSTVNGPFTLRFTRLYGGPDVVYSRLMAREYYPLPITELQVRAEQTCYAGLGGNSTSERLVQQETDTDYFQVEVRQLVEHVAHLPPQVECAHPIATKGFGVCLAGGRQTVLQVRPLRALRPMLSTDSQFCALNLYQLAMIATLSECPFDSLSGSQQREQARCQAALLEDVAYSRRFEIVPFDPILYPCNDPHSGVDQHTPASVHFFDQSQAGVAGMAFRSFVTHSDEVLLISVSGASEWPEHWQDNDALQVPFEEGEGNVHRGFYACARQVYDLVSVYLEMFYAGQTILVCGRGLGGASALILSQMLCNRSQAYNLQLYTYGAPRAADAAFVSAAEGFVHHRMVHHDDPLPSTPGNWTNTCWSGSASEVVFTFDHVPDEFGVFVAGLSGLTTEPYKHHGHLWHFMPMQGGGAPISHVLWAPVSDTVLQQAVSRAVFVSLSGGPGGVRVSEALLNAGRPGDRYLCGCRAIFQRYQQALELGCALLSEHEVLRVDQAFEHITQQLRAKCHEQVQRAGVKKQEREHVENLLMREIGRVQQTREHLYRLRFKTPDLADVYGRCAQHPEWLEECLARWQPRPGGHQLIRVPGSGGKR